MTTHSHAESAAAAGARRLGVVLLLVLAFGVVEVLGGIATNSLALWADAGHMATDAAGILLALLAIWLARRPATPGQVVRLLPTSRSSPRSSTRSSSSALRSSSSSRPCSASPIRRR